jgi:hypothetical protein
MSAKKQSLADALRQTGRHFQAGEPINIDVLSGLIEEQRAQQPQMCATLTDLLQAIQDETRCGNRGTALKHFRAAIDLATDSDKRRRAVAKGE